jgi:hypothetical protein
VQSEVNRENIWKILVHTNVHTFALSSLKR